MFYLKNVSDQRLAVLKWNIPANDKSLSGSIFKVSQGGRGISYTGMMVEFVEDDSSVIFLKPGEVIRAVVPVRDSYRLKTRRGFSIEYDTCLQFRPVNPSVRRVSFKGLKRIECITSNKILVD